MKNNKKIAAIIQARMGSERLPGKVLKTLCGRPMLWHIVERLKFSKLLNQIILALPDAKGNEDLEKFAVENSIKYFKGSEDWVLERVFFAAKENNCDVIVRITADNPLMDPEIIDEAIKQHLKSGADYSCTEKPERFLPLGMGVEVFNFDSLQAAYNKSKESYDREHVTSYLYENPDVFKINSVKLSETLRAPHLRLTMDTKEDLELMEKIYQRLYRPENIFKTEQILNLFVKNPELRKINGHIIQKAS